MDGLSDRFGLESLATQLTKAMAAIHQRGWCDGTGGNFSCVWQQDPLQLLMAPSGVDKGSVEPDQLILVDANARVISGHGKASAETLLHLAIVVEAGAGAVLHTHSQAATLLSYWALDQAERSESGCAALAISGLEMLKGLQGVSTHATTIHIPVLPNNQDLRALSASARPHLAQAPHGLLIGGHGLYAWGTGLGEAKRHLEILEFLLEQQWRRLLLQSLMHPMPGCEHSDPVITQRHDDCKETNHA
ncbi:methylthioribulose 1-phosphate dehydratase [Synechococcus sp. CS-1328]|uniref:methylthioribulose 1-phosphate dehydratase n=1 Tax=Synechococcus sp. CS-1328 TaxID=2847976 RepID=UPI00223C0E94|nr:methylthioribulose 1-phosphate dehydratase [Synechococcus sp. CS-1328]MCT0225054.1 methylthioribulose 1-phosphate dehydratase [Synechococcus sp. CS-1328]